MLLECGVLRELPLLRRTAVDEVDDDDPCESLYVKEREFAPSGVPSPNPAWCQRHVRQEQGGGERTERGSR